MLWQRTLLVPEQNRPIHDRKVVDYRNVKNLSDSGALRWTPSRSTRHSDLLNTFFLLYNKPSQYNGWDSVPDLKTASGLQESFCCNAYLNCFRISGPIHLIALEFKLSAGLTFLAQPAPLVDHVLHYRKIDLLPVWLLPWFHHRDTWFFL